MIILLVLLFILIILRLFVVKEGFELKQKTLEDYDKYIQFYNPFMVNWKKAIVSAIAMNTPQEPLTDPSEKSSNKVELPSDDEMNLYISKLSKDMGKPFPPVTDPIPDDIDYDTLVERIPMIKSDPSAYINALDWMNSHLQESQDKLKSALKGNSVENFEDQCEDISACLANNPDLIKKIIQAQKDNEQNEMLLNEDLISQNVTSFLNDKLKSSAEMNSTLVENAKKVQNDAKSGKMLDQLDLPKEDEISFEIPKGGDKLSKMKESNPDKYNKLEEKNSMWFSIKQLLEEINNGLPT